MTRPTSSPPPGGPVVGFVVPRAVGGAVVRNRVRRRLRELVRARLGQVCEVPAVVIRALPPSAGATFGELAADLDGALEQALRRARTGSPA